jgi:hypothetical protein
MHRPPPTLGGFLLLLACTAACVLARQPPGEVYSGPAIPLPPRAWAMRPTATEQSEAAVVAAAPRVEVALYAEALCPYCARMLTQVSCTAREHVVDLPRGGGRGALSHQISKKRKLKEKPWPKTPTPHTPPPHTHTHTHAHAFAF